ncbi:hypothetical protein V8G54_033440 [Vigna mungo]|uniref:Uncharacterized protein n=1 Tax=Vigna mungo TaxID=3915 RepID=A0AAQ3MNC7_VIGMU
MRSNSLEKLTSNPPPSIKITTFHIPSYKLYIIHLKKLLIVIPQLDIGDHNALTDLGNNPFTGKQGMVNTSTDRRQKLDSGNGELIPVRRLRHIPQQGPHSKSKIIQICLKFLLILFHIQINILTDLGPKLIDNSKTIAATSLESRISGGEIFSKLTHPLLHVILEKLR